jgi:ATP-dependent DNA helicase RecQ
VIVEDIGGGIVDESKSLKRKRAAIPAAEKKESSAVITLKLFREGKSPSEIAENRGFAQSTIMGHLLSFIPTGEIQADALISPEKIAVILDVITRPEVSGLKNARELLGDAFSYDEIRAVMLSQKKGDIAATPSSDQINN